MWYEIEDDEEGRACDALKEGVFGLNGASFPRIRLRVVQGQNYAGEVTIQASVCVRMIRNDCWRECDLPRNLILEMTQLMRQARRLLPERLGLGN